MKYLKEKIYSNFFVSSIHLYCACFVVVVVVVVVVFSFFLCVRIVFKKAFDRLLQTESSKKGFSFMVQASILPHISLAVSIYLSRLGRNYAFSKVTSFIH